MKTSRINNRIESRKAQIGTTLTWFIGFLIIFFVMILFVTSTVILAASRGVSQKTVEKYNSENLELERNLIKLLNTPVEFENSKMTFKELIKKWDNSEGNERKNIETIFRSTLDKTLTKYYFTIHRDYPNGVNFEHEKNAEKVSSDYKFSSVYLSSDKGLLRISLSYSSYKAVGGGLL